MVSVRVIIVAITLAAAAAIALTWSLSSSSQSSAAAKFDTNGLHVPGNKGNQKARTLSSRNNTRPSADTLRSQLGATVTSSSTICSAITRTATTIPTSFDARTNWDGCISPVLNQASCGACWAFATAQVLSDRICIAGRAASRTVNRLLSPQQLVSCDHGCSDTSTETGCDLGCSGGSLDTPWKYVIATGLVGLSCIPYTSSTGTTGTCPALNSDSVPTCTTTGYTNTAYQSGSCYQLKTVASMQAEILTYGSVVAGMMAYEDFLTYESGVYTVTTTQEAGGHAVRLVGWGTSDEGVDYWILINQWSEDWGMSGTAYIRRGTNEALIESSVVAAQAILPATDEFEAYSTAVAVGEPSSNSGVSLTSSSLYTTMIILGMHLIALLR